MTKKQQQIVKVEDQEIIGKERTEMKNIFVDHSYPPDFTTDLFIKHLRKGKGMDFDDKQEVEKFANKTKELARSINYAYGLETHDPIGHTVKEEYRTFLKGMIVDIEREFDCKTASEKMLSEATASAYVRTIQYSDLLTRCLTEKGGIKTGNNIMELYKIIGKELDRASRIFTSTLQLLIQKKSPQLELNIKAKTAFIGQNQQFNATINQNEQPTETNEPK